MGSQAWGRAGSAGLASSRTASCSRSPRSLGPGLTAGSPRTEGRPFSRSLPSGAGEGTRLLLCGRLPRTPSCWGPGWGLPRGRPSRAAVPLPSLPPLGAAAGGGEHAPWEGSWPLTPSLEAGVSGGHVSCPRPLPRKPWFAGCRGHERDKAPGPLCSLPALLQPGRVRADEDGTPVLQRFLEQAGHLCYPALHGRADLPVSSLPVWRPVRPSRLRQPPHRAGSG